MRRPQALIVPPRVKVPRTLVVLLVSGWSLVAGLRSQVRVRFYRLLGSGSECVSLCGQGPNPGPTGGRSWGNGNPGLYYKSRPEGTWGSPHDTSPTRLPVSVPSDAGLSSKASKVRGSHRCYGTARCTAASEKVHLTRQGLGLVLVAGHGSFGAAPLSIDTDWHGIP